MSKGWIGFDLDGTLATYDGWKGIEHIGTPIEAIVNILRGYLVAGQEVKIFTARVAGPKENADKAREYIWVWLEKLGLPRLEITCEKDWFMLALYDDRAVQVELNTGKIIGSEDFL